MSKHLESLHQNLLNGNPITSVRQSGVRQATPIRLSVDLLSQLTLAGFLLFAADIVVPVGYANLTNTRFLALLTAALTSFYFPFRLLRRNEFLNLVRSNEDMGTNYVH